MWALFLAAGVAGLGPRPPELVGPDRAAYEAKLVEFGGALAQQAQGRGCPDASFTSAGGLALNDASLAANGIKRASGDQVVWDEHLKVEGCGRSQIVKMLVARPPQGWGVLPLPPGTGVVGARLARDVTPAAVSSALLQRPPLVCDKDEQVRTIRLADTSLLTSYVPGKPWIERWNFNVCGQDRAVDIDFTPAADGGTDYHMRTR